MPNPKIVAGLTIGASAVMMAQTSTAIATFNMAPDAEKEKELNKWSYGLAILVLIVSLALFVLNIWAVAPDSVRDQASSFASRGYSAARDMARRGYSAVSE